MTITPLERGDLPYVLVQFPSTDRVIAEIIGYDGDDRSWVNYTGTVSDVVSVPDEWILFRAANSMMLLQYESTRIGCHL